MLEYKGTADYKQTLSRSLPGALLIPNCMFVVCIMNVYSYSVTERNFSGSYAYNPIPQLRKQDKQKPSL